MFNLSQYKEKTCIESSEECYSYSDVNQIADSIKSITSGRNLVLCLCENTTASLAGYISFVTNDQVVILVEANKGIQTIIEIIGQYDPDYAWLPNRYVEQIPSSEPVYKLRNYSLLRMPCGKREREALHENLQLLLSTSGSTGTKKFVRISRNNLIANAKSIIEYLGIRQDDVAITTLPYSYSFGLSIINTHLLVGASIQVTDLNLLSRDFWEIIKDKRVTSLSGVPYTFEMLKRIKFERFELESIRYLSQAGGKLNKEGLEYLNKLSLDKNWPCFTMYGQTEATARMSYLPPKLLGEKNGSIGLPIPGGSFMLVHEDGTEILNPLITGQLIYLGANVGFGYAVNRADLAQGDEWKGRLYTGDLAYRDHDGFYYIVGRISRIIKLYGNRVSLDEVEKILYETFLKDFVCFGKDDLLYVGTTKSNMSAEIISRLSKILSVNHRAIKCVEIESIPRFESGKIDYQTLIARFNDE
jgi:long-chain acyl-CoA synthetase